MFQGVVHQSKIIQEVSNGRPKVKSIRGISKEKTKRKKGNLKLTNKYKILLLEKNRSLSQNITNEYNSLQSYEKSDIKTKVEVQDRADASRNEKLAYCQKTDSSGTNIVESAFKSDQKQAVSNNSVHKEEKWNKCEKEETNCNLKEEEKYTKQELNDILENININVSSILDSPIHTVRKMNFMIFKFFVS